MTRTSKSRTPTDRVMVECRKGRTTWVNVPRNFWKWCRKARVHYMGRHYGSWDYVSNGVPSGAPHAKLLWRPSPPSPVRTPKPTVIGHREVSTHGTGVRRMPVKSFVEVVAMMTALGMGGMR